MNLSSDDLKAINAQPQDFPGTPSQAEGSDDESEIEPTSEDFPGTPSQAEGDAATIDEDLKEKGLE